MRAVRYTFWLLLCAILIMVPRTAFAAVGFVQQTTVANVASGSPNPTFGVNTTAGNVVIAIVYMGGIRTASISGMGATWTTLRDSGSLSGAVRVWIFAGIVVTPGTSTTITISSAASSAQLIEFSGVASPLVADGSNSGNAASGATSQATGSITTTYANDLIVGAVGVGPIAGATGTIASPSSPWNGLNGAAPSTTIFADAASYQIATSTGSFNPSFSWTTATGDGAAVVALEAATNFVQSSAVVNNAVSPITLTFPATTTAANLVTVEVQDSGILGAPSVTGMGATWTKIAQDSTAGAQQSSLFAAIVVTPGTTVSVAFTAGTVSAVAQEWFGISITTDGTGTAAAATGTSVAPTTGATTNAYDLILAFAGHAAIETVTVPSSLWSKLTGSDAATPTIDVVYQLSAATGTYTPSFSWSTTGLNSGAVAAFKYNTVSVSGTVAKGGTVTSSNAASLSRAGYPPTTPNAAGVVFMSGFETGDFSEWGTLNGVPSVVTSPRTFGGYSEQSTWGLSAFANSPTIFSGGVGYIGFNFNTNAVSPTVTNQLVFLQVFNTSSQVSCGLRLQTDSTGTITLGVRSLTGTLGTFTVPSNTWEPLEVKCVAGTTSSNGAVEVRLNGLVVYTNSATNTGTVNLRNISLGVLTNGSSTSGNLWFDDVVVRSDRYPGPGYIIARQGVSGTPTYDAWTKSSGTTAYNLLSETPFNATNNVSTTTASAIQSMNLGSFGAAGSGTEGTGIIAPQDTINAAQTSIVAKSSWSTSKGINIFPRFNGVNTVTAINATASDAFYSSALSTPTYTNLTAASSQIGVQNTGVGAGTAQVEDVWEMVDFTPASLAVAGGGTVTGSRAPRVPVSASVVKGGTITSSQSIGAIARSAAVVKGGSIVGSSQKSFARNASVAQGGVVGTSSAETLTRAGSISKGGSVAGAGTETVARSANISKGGTLSAARAVLAGVSGAISKGGSIVASVIVGSVIAVAATIAKGGSVAASAVISAIRSATISKGGSIMGSSQEAVARSGSVSKGGTIAGSRAASVSRSASVVKGGLISSSFATTISRAASIIRGGVVSATVSVSSLISVSASIIGLGGGMSAARAVAVPKSAAVVKGGAISAARTAQAMRAVSFGEGGQVSAVRGVSLNRSASLQSGGLISTLRRIWAYIVGLIHGGGSITGSAVPTSLPTPAIINLTMPLYPTVYEDPALWPIEPLTMPIYPRIYLEARMP